MPTLDLNLSCLMHDSFRVQQVLGMFDMPSADTLCERFTVEIPGDDEPWQIGVIVGPTGSGKSSVARAAFGQNLYTGAAWPPGQAVIDSLGNFPIHTLTHMLTLVGFSSPPAWIKPFAVLSNGEKFRCELARALLSQQGTEDSGLRTEWRRRRRTELEPGRRAESEKRALPSSLSPQSSVLSPFPSPRLSPQSLVLSPLPPLVFDEFTSLVDRTVAKIASAALSRAIRSGKIKRRFVAVTCHEDIVRWLEPDWVLNMGTQSLSRGRPRRPALRLVIRRADRALWTLFRRHHYLSGNLHRSAQCYVGSIDDRPAVFTAVLPFPHPRRPGWREHRTVCLPDFQGVGIGSTMAAYIASLYVATKKPYFSTTGHPAVVRHRARSSLWKMLRRPGLVNRIGTSGTGKTGMQNTLSAARFTAGFEYVGPGREPEARAMGLVPRPPATTRPPRNPTHTLGH